ncbi:MAG TPA: hypothetical protein VEA69_02560 [Tepidisphaeraceae bacterium]|nr:hypothetical protein [Tepidisphaeraceae bacterium]
MIATRRAAAVLVGVVGLAVIGGCTPPRQEPPPTPPPVATASGTEELRARYLAAGNLVGQVVAVNTEVGIAAVNGIDPAAAGNENAVFTFVDPAGDVFVNNGMLAQKTPTSGGQIVIGYDPQGQRPPQVGDLVVRRK